MLTRKDFILFLVLTAIIYVVVVLGATTVPAGLVAGVRGIV
jgi:hypothetical protein